MKVASLLSDETNNSIYEKIVPVPCFKGAGHIVPTSGLIHSFWVTTHNTAIIYNVDC